MAQYLYHFGKWSYRKRRLVVTGWVVVLIAALVIGLSFKGATSSEFSIPGTKAQEAIDLLGKEFPGANGGTVRLIFAAPDGKTLDSPDVKKAIMATFEQARKDKNVVAILDPFTLKTVSKDNQIGYADVIYNVNAQKVTKESKAQIVQSADAARNAGVQTEFGGSVQLTDFETSPVPEVIGVFVAYAILAFTFASLLAAGLPIITAVIGVGIGIMGVMFVSRFVTMTSTATILAIMLGLAVGIDYALFIVSRHRQQLAEGLEIEESIGRSVATAGSAVVFAGLTVIIALAGLSVTGIPFLSIMGLAASFTVLIAVFIAINLIPAFIGMAGHRLSPARKTRMFRTPPTANQKTVSLRWGRFVTRFPVIILLIGIVSLTVISLPALHMRLGLPDNGAKAKETTEHKGYELLSKGFGSGFNGPLLVVIDVIGKKDSKETAQKVTKELTALPNVAYVSPPNWNQTQKIALVSVVPTTGPNTTETKDLVNSIRNGTDALQKQEEVKLLVTGVTAVNIDVSDKLNSALPVFALVVVGLAIVLLALVFRSLLVPLKSVIGFLLSLTSSLGVVVFIFQDGHFLSWLGLSQSAPILSFLPVLVTGVLFGLAMDYEVFLVSRMREDYIHTGKARESVVMGVGHSGRVVTAAGLIMAAVFASFIFTEDPITKAMGVALTFGVLVDAFVVRMTLVPAVMVLLGRAAWYLPKWLDRIMPNIDIEGESLLKQLTDQAPDKNLKARKDAGSSR
ncbi:membrane protein YdfJ [Paenibacillus baekrokdamisoli]|uniref:Membrane protein YdfJ n=1 Tax=Paenibacillus baekrokdamisoli TaxID=1712516 RepID=A0A3G9IVN0_9BACL|nr:MMPL family transporter [Paenibacillus baekrokdamisoli]MBB3068036.1 membrane protein YdfJ [Paenibacillus baekrokdamisoli]BBH22917.1 membrane protein YdfJ [Paenibacillus baekrokdamisoli]